MYVYHALPRRTTFIVDNTAITTYNHCCLFRGYTAWRDAFGLESGMYSTVECRRPLLENGHIELECQRKNVFRLKPETTATTTTMKK